MHTTSPITLHHPLTCPLATYHHVLRQYIHEPEHFVGKLILRAEIVEEHEREVWRLVHPRVHRQRGPARQCIHIAGDRYTFLPDPTPTTIDDVHFSLPKVRQFSVEWREDGLSVEYHPFPSDQLSSQYMRDFLARLVKFIMGNVNSPTGKYKKRVLHDQLIPKAEYQDLYHELKQKYQYIIDQWPLSTDAHKHVYEDVNIATYLIVLWRHHHRQHGGQARFIDLGCGNGLLTHILTEEGYHGWGCDLWSRTTWQQFPNADLRVDGVQPPSFQLHDDDASEHQNVWLIGNHADELTGWLPLLAARCRCNFFVIPCCFHDLSGQKNRFGSMIPIHGSKYESYLKWCEDMIEYAGFVMEKEWLRIPSTKNVAYVGRMAMQRAIDREALEQYIVAHRPQQRRLQSDKHRKNVVYAEPEEEVVGIDEYAGDGGFIGEWFG